MKNILHYIVKPLAELDFLERASNALGIRRPAK